MQAVFLDADGTLFHHEGYIPNSAKRAIQKAQANGHKIILCTGRQLVEIYGDLATIDYDAIVAGAGAVTKVGETILDECAFSKEQIQTLKAYMDAHDIPALYESPEAIYCSKQDKEKVKAIADHWCKDLSEEERKNHGITLVYEHLSEIDTNSIDQYPIVKITFLESNMPFAQIKNDLSNDFELIQATFAPLGKESGEIAAYGIDKARGMRILKDYFHADTLIAIGDAQNDLCMFDVADVSIAMGNATEEVKQKADRITASLEEDGILKAFEDLQLI